MNTSNEQAKSNWTKTSLSNASTNGVSWLAHFLRFLEGILSQQLLPESSTFWR